MSFGYQVLGFGSGGLVKPSFTIATGGNTILTVGDYKTHVFTGPGTFVVTAAGNVPDFPGDPLAGPSKVDYFNVAGGAGCIVGGGGGGGFRTSYPSPDSCAGAHAIGIQSYPITVGAGAGVGSSGNPSIFSTITSAGGGKGQHYVTDGGDGPGSGVPGGCGGGAGHASGCATGGVGNTPPVSPPQGKNGGNSGPSPAITGGGGGGADCAGAPGPGVGGSGRGIATGFFGPTAPSYGETGPAGRYFSGGGGGSLHGSSPAQAGGLGGGGNGCQHSGTPGIAGAVNMGGGGGGATQAPNSAGGGSGLVSIRYKFQ